MTSIPRLRYAVALVVLFAITRAVGWYNAPILDEHDSATYLEEAAALATDPIGGLVALSPDCSPLFPWLAGQVSRVAPSLESAARIVSILFSLLVGVLVATSGRIAHDALGGWLGAALLAAAPLAISFSYSILSEPTYVGLVVAGWWVVVFAAQREVPSIGSSVAAGLLFGLAFLARFEGIIYAALVPVAFAAGAWRPGTLWRRTATETLRFSATFLAAFAVVAGPQVYRVSATLDSFALNGRQLWWQILHVADGRSYDQKLYGLDHSPALVNLLYLQRHPEARPGDAAQASIVENLEIWVDNWLRFYSTELGTMFGPLMLALFFAGLVALAVERRWAFLVQALLFIGSAAGIALLATALPRHFLVLMPMVALIAGVGARWLGAQLGPALRIPAGRAAVGLVCLTALAWVPLHAKVFLRPDSPFLEADFAPAASLVQAWRDERSGELPVVVARQRYLSYLTGARHVPLPYTDLAGLLQYLRLNDAQFLFLELRALEDQPFLKELRDGPPPPGLRLLDERMDSWGFVLRLFAVEPRDVASSVPGDCASQRVLLVHGLGQDASLFEPLIQHLVASGYQRRCLQAVSIQPSTASNVLAAEEVLAPAVAAALGSYRAGERLQRCERMQIVAHSMGALSARWFATQLRPTAVSALITTSGANHGTNWRCENPMGPGHVEMCPGFAGSAAASAVQFVLNGAPGADVDETPWSPVPDSAGVRSVRPDEFRQIVYATLESPGDPFIVPSASLRLDGSGGFGGVAIVPGIREAAPGAFIVNAAPGHDELLRTPAALEQIARLLRATVSDCHP